MSRFKISFISFIAFLFPQAIVQAAHVNNEIVGQASYAEAPMSFRNSYLYQTDEVEYPSATPVMTVETEDGTEEDTEYSGSAPIVAHFTSNPSNVGSYTPLYEWHVYEAGKEDAPYLIRYDQDFDYTFTKSGTSYISLVISFVLDGDTIEYEMDSPFSVTASESVLNVPNAFSPNGDGQNDIFRVKEGYKSIIEFHGYIFNRWGKKLFEWKNIDEGWDGKHNGSDVPDGVYYCRIDAKGADGKVYKIRKAVNLLRGYLPSTSTATGN